MSSLPLVRINQLRPTLAFLEERGLPVPALLRRARLPVLAVDDDEAFVPGRLIYRFLDLAADSGDLPDLGAQVALGTDLEDLHWLADSKTGSGPLRDRLQVLFRESVKESSQMRMWLHADSGSSTCLHYLGSGGPETPGGDQVEQYMVVLLTRFIREAAADHWTPDLVRLQAPASRELRRLPLFEGTRFQTRQESTAISIPSDLLWSVDQVAGADSEAPGFLESLRLAFVPYLSGEELGIDLAAEMAGMSTRTLQRRLSALETSFTEQLERVRRDTAILHLRESRKRVHDIALELGYSDAPHFTRAFQRWTGVTPGSFRRGRQGIRS